MARWLILSLVSVGLLAGCVVVAPRPPCPGGVWIEGHYDRMGRWHRAHWRCPGVIEEEVIIRER